MGRNRPSHRQYSGTIDVIRAIEDRIRASQKYTEGILTRRHKHPPEVQGDGFPSRVFCKYYEVYPDADFTVSWNMKAEDFMTLVWGETKCVRVTIFYDYRSGKATVEFPDELADDLFAGVAGLSEAVAAAHRNGKGEVEDITGGQSAKVARQYR